MEKTREQMMPSNSMNGKPKKTEPHPAFRGSVNMNTFDDAIDPDARYVLAPIGDHHHVQPIPIHKTREEIDRKHKYNVMMGRVPNGYIFED